MTPPPPHQIKKEEYIKNVGFATTMICVLYNAIGIHHVHKHENQCQVFKT